MHDGTQAGMRHFRRHALPDRKASDMKRRVDRTGWKAATICAVASLLSSMSCLFNPVELGDHDDFRTEFDLVWNHFDSTYIGFMFTDAEWDEAYSQYSGSTDSMESQDDFISMLMDMLACLEDPHVYLWNFVGADSVLDLQPWFPETEPNYDMDVLWEYLDSLSSEGFTSFQYDSLWGYCFIDDSIPYIMIDSWTSFMNPRLLISLLDTLPETRALIIDVRMNGGGQEQAILDLASTINGEARTGYFRVFKAGPGHDDLAPPVPVLIQTRNDYISVPIMVLIGEGSRSASEVFASICDEIPGIILAGDSTQGNTSWCFSEEAILHLPGDWSVFVPNCTALRADTVTYIQGNGIPPDIYVEASEADFEAGTDPVLEYAVEWARSQ